MLVAGFIWFFGFRRGAPSWSGECWSTGSTFCTQMGSGIYRAIWRRPNACHYRRRERRCRFSNVAGHVIWRYHRDVALPKREAALPSCHVNPADAYQTFAASPYLPMQYNYNDWVPSQAYYAFAAAANCSNERPYGYGQRNSTIFDCLVNAPTEVLQTAGYRIGASGPDYEWVFLPVTDGVFVQERPSQQLSEKKLNGVNILVGVSRRLSCNRAELILFSSRTTQMKVNSSFRKASPPTKTSTTTFKSCFLTSTKPRSHRSSTCTPD